MAADEGLGDGFRMRVWARSGGMSKVQTASERITEEVTSWPGVTAGPGRRGEFAFKVGGREIDPRRHRAAPSQLRPRSHALT